MSSNKRVHIHEDNQALSPDSGSGTAKHSAVSFRSQSMGGGGATRHSVAGRMSSGGKVRESFAAALWNPMRDVDKEAFNRRRLIQLFCGILIATCGGSAFAFGIFSNKIKAKAGLTQSEMTTITTTGAILGAFTFPAGVLFDNLGPNYVLAAATLFSVGGFGILALVFGELMPATVYTIAISKGLSSIGSGFFDTGSLMANLFNFPINRGDVLIIQKTFFGLGSTFFSLIFDGFFGPSQNYLGYAISVTGVMLVSGVLGTVFIRLPPYKRSLRDLRRIRKMTDPVAKEEERLLEERAFEMYHNPRLTARRRLNAGISVLMFSLVFFSLFSVAKTYIDLPQNVILGLTILAIICLLAFTIMIVPFQIPAFFDFDFLPDMSPPEALVDKSAVEKDGGKGSSGGNNINNGGDETGSEHNAVGVNNDSIAAREYCENDPLINGQRGGEVDDSAFNGGANKSSHHHHHDDDDEHHREDGRASAFLPVRASVVQNSAPIAVPEGIAPSIVPCIPTSFLQSVMGPMIWCMWIIGFTKASIGVIVGNQAQIMNAANDGDFDAKNNSLAVALLGIGSAIGRILIGVAETFFQRRNALHREKQLRWEAENGPACEEQRRNAPEKGEVDLRPAFHRYDSTVVCLFPVFPAILTLCVFAFTFAPVSMFPIIFVPLGACHGGWISIGALAIREMFSKDVAMHYSFTVTSGIVASITLNRFMFGTWFDEETERSRGADGYSCAGYACFRNSLYVVGSLCIFSTFVSAYTAHRWWRIRQTFF